MILRILIRKEECPENDHFLNNQILKKYSSFYVLLFDSGPMETIRGIYKKNRRNGTLFGFSVSTEIKVLMGIPA